MVETLNADNSIKKETQLYGLIAEEATKERLFAELNKLLKPQAMMLPLNIRQDDFYFTIKGLKNAKVSGVYIALEYQEEVVEILDYKDDFVEVYQKCDFILIKDGMLHGHFVQTNDINSTSALAEKIYQNYIQKDI